jgi:hypothetical protein
MPGDSAVTPIDSEELENLGMLVQPQLPAAQTDAIRISRKGEPPMLQM